MLLTVEKEYFILLLVLDCYLRFLCSTLRAALWIDPFLLLKLCISCFSTSKLLGPNKFFYISKVDLRFFILFCHLFFVLWLVYIYLLTIINQHKSSLKGIKSFNKQKQQKFNENTLAYKKRKNAVQVVKWMERVMGKNYDLEGIYSQ